MLVNRKLKYLVSTPFGLLDLKAKEVKKMLESGEIKDGKTIIALQAYLLKNK